MTRRLLLTLLIVVCVSILPAVNALACHCYFNSPEVEFALSHAVFIGTILLIQPSSDPDILHILVQVNGFWKGVGISPTWDLPERCRSTTSPGGS